MHYLIKVKGIHERFKENPKLNNQQRKGSRGQNVKLT